MKTTIMFSKRNIQLYLREYMAVFFSFLTIIIILVLTICFLGKLTIDDLILQSGVSKSAASYFTYSWVLAGVVTTATITIPLNILGIMIEDEEKKKMKAFFTSPISRMNLTLGYFFSAFLVGCILSVMTLIISQSYLLIMYHAAFSLMQWIKAIGTIIVNVFSNTCIMYFLVSFIRSSRTFSAINVIIGTLIGFIAGIYLPIGMLPDIIQKGMKCLPVMHGCAIMREIFVVDAIEKVFNGAPETVINEYKEYMGIRIAFGNNTINLNGQLLILIGSGIFFILLTLLMIKKRKITDR